MAQSGAQGSGAQGSWLERLWAGIADQGFAFARVPAADLAGPERARQLAEALLSERGEASGAALARELLQVLRGLSEAERLDVLCDFSRCYVPEEAPLRAAAEAYLAAPGPKAAALLHEAAEPPRQELLRRMNMAVGGTALLVDLRREVLGALKQNPETCRAGPRSRCICSPPGSTGVFSSCVGSTGRRRRRCWKS